MSLEASLDICLKRNPQSGAIMPQIRSSRRMDVARLFIGKSADELLSLLPRLYAICGLAHCHAAALATDFYRGQPERKVWGDALVLTELAREHCLHILTRWQGTDPQRAIAEHLRPWLAETRKLEAMKPKMEPYMGPREDGALAQIKQVATSLRKLLEEAILGDRLESLLALDSKESFARWLDQKLGQTGALVRGHFDGLAQALSPEAEAGAIAAHFLPVLGAEDAERLRTLLLSVQGEAFAAQPTWLGECCETGPLQRQVSHPLMQAHQRDGQFGLTARHLARLVDLARIPARLDALADVHAYDDASQQPGQQPCEGVGQVETARGLLLHAAQLQGDRIVAYRILAPTEWNFHPQGAAAQSLASLAPHGDLDALAKLIIEALDPCVAYRLTLDEAFAAKELCDA